MGEISVSLDYVFKMKVEAVGTQSKAHLFILLVPVILLVPMVETMAYSAHA